MTRDHNGLEILDRTRCLALLAGVSVARIGLSVNGTPVVLPVFIALRHDEVIICSGEGTKLDAALRNAIVAIEADSYDPVSRAGWSVVVKGRVRPVTGPVELEQADELGLPTWPPGRSRHFLSVRPDLISGRALNPSGAEPTAG